ncbi:hypothetical protein POTOM_024148 [Populus tomentosa]|uniref:Uncharacterized protein n=1 Tax=Populus tomentosa TaxID=118781 RepID=A0A8X7ZUS9_POPTO|nr:hypothetical protein POTOM_024148 [Populus tomentosa]
MVTVATKCGVEELDMLVHVDSLRGYSLPDCVYKCESLRALKLNLQMGRLTLENVDGISDLTMTSSSLEDLEISDCRFPNSFIDGKFNISCSSLKNDSPIVFKKLQNLVLLTDGSFADQIPTIASFLRGLPNLRRLIIRCEQISHELSDPNASLTESTLNPCVGQDLKNVKIEAVQGQLSRVCRMLGREDNCF